MDKVLISEAILKIGKGLANLKDKLTYIQGHLPPYEELSSCINRNPTITKLFLNAGASQGVEFHHEVTYGYRYKDQCKHRDT